MELVIYGLVFVALIAIVILLVKHIFLMCSRIVAAAWHAAILFLIFLPILAITGHINISIEESTISVVCGQVESLCPEPRPTLEEALIHMIKVHEANESNPSNDPSPLLVREEIEIFGPTNQGDGGLVLINTGIAPHSGATPHYKPVENEIP